MMGPKPGCGPLLPLLLLLLLSSCTTRAIKIGVFGDEEILSFLAGMSSSEAVRRFGVSSINATRLALGPDPETVPEMRSYIQSVRMDPPDVIIGDYNGTLALVATELSIPYYCTSPAHSSSDLSDTAYLQSSTLLVMNTYVENMVLASQKLTSSVISRQVLIIVADTISDSVNSLVNSLSNEELHMVILGNSSGRNLTRDALFNVSLVASIPSAVFQTMFSQNDTLSMVLPEAASLSLMKNDSIWIVSDLFADPSLLLDYRRTGASIFSFGLDPPGPIFDNGGLKLAMAEDSVGHFVRSLADRTAFDLPTALSILYNGVLGSLQFDSETRRNQESTLKIALTSFRNNYTEQFGLWKKSAILSGITVTGTRLTTQLPQLRALAYLREPFVMSTATEYFGFSITVLNDISAGLFTVEVTEVSEESMLLSSLQEGAGDLIVNPMSVILAGKYQNVTITPWPLMYTGTSAMGYAEDRKSDFLSPLYPFSWNVWLAVIIAFVILSVTLYSTDKISPNDYKRPKFSMSESVFFVYSSFMMSKLRPNAVKPSSRIFILILWFASLMYCTTYGTNYFYMLIRSDNNLPFNSLLGLYDKGSQYYRILLNNSRTVATLASQPEGSYYRKLSQPDVLVSTEATALSIINNVTLMDKKRPIFIGDQRVIQYFVAKSCDLKMTTSEELHQPLYLALNSRLDPDLIDAISIRIQTMADRGVIDQYLDTYWSAVKCSSNDKLISISDLQAVKIEQVAGIFIVLACALVFSFFVLLLEYVFHLLKLHFQRINSMNSGLEFGRKYRVEVIRVTQQGIHVRVQGTREFLPNQVLSPDPNKTLSAAELQIQSSDVVEVVYLGNDPKTGERLFKRTG